MQQPIEVDVDESQQVVGRVAAIDVAKATGMVCTRVPHPTIEGKRLTKVWEVKATTKGLVELADHLVANKAQRTVLESTSDYWRRFFYILEGKATTGKGSPYLKAALGQMAMGAAKTDTFLGTRYRRLAKRTPKAKALAALERSILVIIFHLLADPTATFEDLGADYYEKRVDNSATPPTWSASSKPSVTASPSPPPPDQPPHAPQSHFGAYAPSGAPPPTPPGGLNRRACFTVVIFRTGKL